MTQAIIKKALETKNQAEAFLQSFSDESLNLDKSLDEDRDKQINQLKKMLKEKDKMMHIKNGKFVELEITNSDLLEENEKLEKEIGRLKAREAKLQEDMDRLVDRTDSITKKAGGPSPSKMELKSKVVMMTESCEDLHVKAKKLEEFLLLEKQEVHRLKREAESMVKVKMSLDEAIVEADNLKEEVEKKDKLISQLKKKIKCEDKDCTRGKKCGYAHHINDRQRSRSTRRRDQKKVLCHFYKAGYCRKTEEECDFGHFDTSEAGRGRSQSAHGNENSRNRRERSRDNLTQHYSSISSMEDMSKGEKSKSRFSREDTDRSGERYDRFKNDRSGRSGAGRMESTDRRSRQSRDDDRRMSWEGNGQGVSGNSRPEAPRSRQNGNRDLYDRVNSEQRWNRNGGFGHRGRSLNRNQYQRDHRDGNQERREYQRGGRESYHQEGRFSRHQNYRGRRFDQGRR